MNDFDLSQALAEAVGEILEKMFFIDTSESGPEDGTRLSAEDAIAARLTFDGDPPGWLQLQVDCPQARSLAADFLGEEPCDVSAKKMEEVVCELANMICGSVLSRVEGTTDFHLAAPAITLDNEAASMSVTASQAFSLPDGVLKVIMAMEC